ncbi:hypothetical protein NKR23_g3718 [Pleurostoma richardsiae]|uniref:Uncharacterized protein n=1 Tax=Pleurostoma richardsiae TaxID=41990 RepID=A0AA38RTF8_9PEZI|nr:hypothetical protein NKR23_g3718 [Pleurostoma richardsiae]
MADGSFQQTADGTQSAPARDAGFVLYSFIEGDQSDDTIKRKIYRPIPQVSHRDGPDAVPYRPRADNPPSWVDDLHDRQRVVQTQSLKFRYVTRELPWAEQALYPYPLGHAQHPSPGVEVEGDYSHIIAPCLFQTAYDVLFLDRNFWRAYRHGVLHVGEPDFPIYGFPKSQLEQVEAVGLEPEDFFLPEAGSEDQVSGLHAIFRLLPNVKEILVIGTLFWLNKKRYKLKREEWGYMIRPDRIALDQLEAWRFETPRGPRTSRSPPSIDETAQQMFAEWPRLRSMFARPNAGMEEVPQVAKWVMVHEGFAWQELRYVSEFPDDNCILCDEKVVHGCILPKDWN